MYAASTTAARRASDDADCARATTGATAVFVLCGDVAGIALPFCS
jgi:hypothetical protein